jgi:hypothetical protein
VRVENRRFYAEKMGEIVTDRLEENFRELMNYDFTAQMEDRLDQVANHEAEWKKVLDSFFGDFSRQLDQAKESRMKAGCVRIRWCLPVLIARLAVVRWGSVLPVPGCSSAAPVMPFRQKSVAKPPLTWCRKTKY